MNTLSVFTVAFLLVLGLAQPGLAERTRYSGIRVNAWLGSRRAALCSA